jgi:hypothetical protein
MKAAALCATVPYLVGSGCRKAPSPLRVSQPRAGRSLALIETFPKLEGER